MSLLSVVVTLWASVAPVVPASAQDRTDAIAERLDQIERQRTALLQQEGLVRDSIEKESVRRDVLTRELSELEAVLSDVQTRVDAASAGLKAIQSRIDAKHRAVANAEKMLAKGVRDIRERAKHIYKHGPASFFDMFADVRGVGDFVRRIAVVGHVVKEDEREIIEVRKVRALIADSLRTQERLRKEADAQLQIVSVERKRAAAAAAVVSGRRHAVSGELESSYSELGDIKAQRSAYEKESSELRAESEAIASFLRGRGSSPAQVAPKEIIWPVSGPVTSGFGWREHPVLGGRRFHTGIDIGASTGTLIAAAGIGEVVFAGEKNGYGNTVIVDHGGGIATLYAHQSAIAVSVGQIVPRGHRIGFVGCTGYCTGPHLHFEVRVNGEPVDPMGWLP